MLAPVAFVARSQLRRRRVAMIGIGAFVGIAGALSMSLIAGARRSASVVDRFFAAASPYDALVYSPSIQRSEMLSLPGVKRADPNAYVALSFVDKSGRVSRGINGLTADFTAPRDPTIRVLRGRMPDGRNPLEVIVNEAFAQQFDTSVGDQVRVRMFSLDQGTAVEQGIYEPSGPEYELTVTAVVRFPQDIVVDQGRSALGSIWRSPNQMLLSYPFWEMHHREFLDYGNSYLVQLDGGSSAMPALADALQSIVGPDERSPAMEPASGQSRQASFTTPVGLETTALLALGIGLAIASAATTVLLLRTEQRFHERETPTLRALGFTPPQLAALAAARTLPVALGGGVGALVGAIALSNRFPIGIGRQLELHQGFQVNVTVVALGTVVIVAFIVGVGILTSRSWRRSSPLVSSRFTLTQWLRRSGAPTEATLGAHIAFDSPSGRRSLTTRQGFVGGVVALVVVGAVGIWVAGVDRLYEVPSRHGWPWDVAIGNVNFKLSPQVVSRLARDSRLSKQTTAAFGQASLNGMSTELLAIDASGTAPPVVLTGRLPTAPSEVALGERVRRTLGVALGDTVTFSVAGGEFESADGPAAIDRGLTVVGTAIGPMFGESNLGDVSVVTLDAIHEAGGDSRPSFVLARLQGRDPSAVAIQLGRELPEEQLTDIVPARVVNMHRVRGVPLLGIALAGTLGTVVLAFVVFAGVRSYRRELAVLRAIGLDAKRVRRVVLWQGALTATVVVAVGLPLAWIAGTALWGRAVEDLGVQPGTAVPPALVLVVPASLAVAVVVALFADRSARRAHVAEVLRAE